MYNNPIKTMLKTNADGDKPDSGSKSNEPGIVPSAVFVDIKPDMITLDERAVSGAVEKLEAALKRNKSSGKLQEGISPFDANIILKATVLKVRKNLDFLLSQDSDEGDFEHSTLRTLCSWGSKLSYFILEGAGIGAVATNMNYVIPEGEWGHAITIADIPVTIDGKTIEKNYLIDTTFKQFCTTEGLPAHMNIHLKPGYKLNETKQGQQLATQLLTTGYCELTPEKAKLYIEAFHVPSLPFPPIDDYVQALKESPRQYAKYDTAKSLLESGFTLSLKQAPTQPGSNTSAALAEAATTQKKSPGFRKRVISKTGGSDFLSFR
jgi:hypothetical protein